MMHCEQSEKNGNKERVMQRQCGGHADMRGLNDETNNAEKNNTDNNIVERERNGGENDECLFPLGLVSAVYMI